MRFAPVACRAASPAGDAAPDQPRSLLRVVARLPSPDRHIGRADRTDVTSGRTPGRRDQRSPAPECQKRAARLICVSAPAPSSSHLMWLPFPVGHWTTSGLERRRHSRTQSNRRFSIKAPEVGIPGAFATNHSDAGTVSDRPARLGECPVPRLNTKLGPIAVRVPEPLLFVGRLDCGLIVAGGCCADSLGLWRRRILLECDRRVIDCTTGLDSPLNATLNRLASRCDCSEIEHVAKLTLAVTFST